MSIEVVLSIRCLGSALQNQLIFHVKRIDRGLSLMPRLQLWGVASTPISMALTVVLYTLLRNRGSNNVYSITISAAISTAVLLLINPFTYPHYILWFEPLAIAALAMIYRRKGVGLSAIYIAILSAIGIAYWRFYRNSAIVFLDSIAFYCILAFFITQLITFLLQDHRS